MRGDRAATSLERLYRLSGFDARRFQASIVLMDSKRGAPFVPLINEFRMWSAPDNPSASGWLERSMLLRFRRPKYFHRLRPYRLHKSLSPTGCTEFARATRVCTKRRPLCVAWRRSPVSLRFENRFTIMPQFLGDIDEFRSRCSACGRPSKGSASPG